MKTSLALLVTVLTVAFWIHLKRAPAEVGEGADLILPLRVHLVTEVEMVRRFEDGKGRLHETPMTMTLSVAEVEEIMEQVNAIWAPSGIRWETDVAAGGGGIVKDVAGGGLLSSERVEELSAEVVGRMRDSQVNYMGKVFPALGDPANNESLLESGRLDSSLAKQYHLYLFPYVGQTLQGTAQLPGTFAIVGTFSDKRPRRKGFPEARPHLVPLSEDGELLAENFPAAGALSSTIAHELGHNLTLRHVDEGMPDNLMKGHVKLRLGPAQTEKARAQALKGPLL